MALDFESEYGDELSVRLQGPVQYALAANIFLVGIYAPASGVEYVGPPADAPWEQIAGAHWLSHNAGFDQAVWQACVARKIIPSFPGPSEWDCTADLSAYAGVGRKLNEAVKNSFGEDLSKSIRNRAGNRHWPEDFNPGMQEDFHRYCLMDAKWCYRLWEKWSSQWPEKEIRFSRILRARGLEGVTLDLEALSGCRKKLMKEVVDGAAKIPWEEPKLSHAKLLYWCGEQGIPAPKSTAMKNGDADAWEKQYGDAHPILATLRNYRKANRRLNLVQAFERRLMANGRMNYSLKYHGAGNTGRLSGSDGLNMQNLNRESENGIDLRGCLAAAPGKIFQIADFAQIEPRIVAAICQDWRLLELLRKGYNFYEVDARLAGVWDGEPGTFKADRKRYQLQKAQTLGIGYGMGPKRFIEAAHTLLGLDFSLEEATRIISGWHRRYPGVKRVWHKLESAMRRALILKECFKMRLPSGRALTYYDLRTEPGDKISASTTMNGAHRQFYWGGVLFENLIQAIARDVLVEATLALEGLGIPVLWSAHDEVVCEVDPEVSAQKILSVMRTSPPWMPDLPLEDEVMTAIRYLK